MQNQARKAVKSPKQPSEITNDYLEESGRLIAELPTLSGFDQHLYQLGQDFYLVKARVFLDGKLARGKEARLILDSLNREDGPENRHRRIATTHTVLKLTRKEAMDWFVKNIAPETFHKDLRGAFVPNSRKANAIPEPTKSKITPEFLETNAVKLDEGETDWGLDTIYLFKGQYYAVRRRAFLNGEKQPLCDFTPAEEKKLKRTERVVKLTKHQMLRQAIEQSFTGRMKRMLLERVAR